MGERASDSGSMSLAGTWRAVVADDARRRTFHHAEMDDRHWEEITIPGHWRSSPAFVDTDGPVLHRRRFHHDAGAARATDGRDDRWWLVLDGILYTSDVWLDGAYVGDTEGYFFPHAFEITEQLVARDDHLLALEVGCTPQRDRTAKRNLTGVLQHWDLLDQTWNPGGVWGDVRIERSGPVRVRHLRVLCRDADEASATVFVRAVLDSAATATHEVRTRIGTTEHRSRHALAAGENRLEWTVTVARPRLWWPHSLGDQPLEDVEIAVLGTDGRVSDRRRRRIGLRRVELRDWILSVNGERLFLKGSNQGPTSMALAEGSDDDARRVVAMARDANLDFLRVHAHVATPAFYDAADETGLLLWQDMPLQWGYHRSVRGQARRQARELVDLLGHRPSIFVWCGHNEPSAIDVEPSTVTGARSRAALTARALVGQVLPSWNRSILDFSVKRVLEHTDGSRAVVPHSGVLPHPPQLEGTDTHAYFGWYYGEARWFERAVRLWPRLARFVSEFGAQAVPENASFLEPHRWPDLDWDLAHRRFALQRPFFDRYVPPAAFSTFEEWRDATQAYQAELVRHHVETLRRLKYRPCGGFAQFCLADGYPAVTWSVVGHDRVPKAGYRALQDACRPVIVVADPLPPRVRPGDALGLDIHLVNDRRIGFRDSLVTAHLSWGTDAGRRSPEGASMVLPTAPGPRHHVWRWHGDLPADCCIRVATLQAVVPDHPGGLQLDLRFEAGDELVDNRYRTRIVAGSAVDDRGAASRPTAPSPLGT